MAVPSFNAAAMDGFAVAGDGPWHILGQLLAGSAPAGTKNLHDETAVEFATLIAAAAHRASGHLTGDCRNSAPWPTLTIPRTSARALAGHQP